MDAYKEFSAQAYGCTHEQVEQAVANHWANLEMGKLKPDVFWDKVGEDLRGRAQRAGLEVQRIWDGLIADNVKLNKEMIETVRQVRAAKDPDDTTSLCRPRSPRPCRRRAPSSRLWR